MIKLPYGIADFYGLRTRDMLYVDRTRYIRDVEDLGDVLVFLRPRRFGKSLWLQTLANYYDIRRAGDFERLFGSYDLLKGAALKRKAAGRGALMNLNQITLPVMDFDRSVAFYRNMGFTLIVHSPPRYARFECPEGDSTFSLHTVDHAVGDTGVVVYFECSDLDAQVDRLLADGFEFTQLPTDESWLWREARLIDPSGNVICLFWAGENRKNPPWRVSA